MSIRSRANPPGRVQLSFEGPGRTKQAFRDECDINNILAQYIRTGTISHVRRFGGDYASVPALDFHEAMNIVTSAEQMFDALPAKLRQRFGGEAGKFLEFVQDESNKGEMRALGLLSDEAAAEFDRAAKAAEKAAEKAPEAPEPLSLESEDDG